MGAAVGRAARRNPSWRRRLVRAERKALARRDGHYRDDAHRRAGEARRQGRRVVGKGERRAVRRLTPTNEPTKLIRSTETMYKSKAYSAASATSPLARTTISRREPTEKDVQ